MADEKKKIDPYDVEALEKSLNDSATRVSAIWLSFLIFIAYLAITVAGTSHRHLLLEEPIKLPIANIDLPIWYFFVVTPILLVPFHFYVLLQILLLGRTAAAYNRALSRTLLPPSDSSAFRQRLANTLFAQIFAGSPMEREGATGAALKLAALSTLVVAPALVLVAFQFAFLPYQSQPVTWLHRLLILVDLALMFALQPLSVGEQRRFEPLQICREPALWVSAALFVLIALSLGTFPGEVHVNLFTGHWPRSVQCDRWIAHRYDRLYVTSVDAVDEKKLAAIEIATDDEGKRPFQGSRTRNFQRRNLNCGVLDLADLRRADFGGAWLIGAQFRHARLQGASFYRSHIEGADFSNAQLQGASLDNVNGASARFYRADLQAASLDDASLQGALLKEAKLFGASLLRTGLEAAELRAAHLDGAFLDQIRLRGASLEDAFLVAVSLTFADLQRVYWHGAKLTNTEIDRAYVWGTEILNCEGAWVQQIEPNFVPDPLLARSPADIDRWIMSITEYVPERNELRERLRKLLIEPGPADSEFIKEANESWGSCEPTRSIADVLDQSDFEKAWKKADASRIDFVRARTRALRDIACNAATKRKATAEGIIYNWINGIKPDNEMSVALARGLLGIDGSECLATKELTDRLKGDLRAYVTSKVSSGAPMQQVPSSAQIFGP